MKALWEMTQTLTKLSFKQKTMWFLNTTLPVYSMYKHFKLTVPLYLHATEYTTATDMKHNSDFITQLNESNYSRTSILWIIDPIETGTNCHAKKTLLELLHWCSIHETQPMLFLPKMEKKIPVPNWGKVLT